ncbi:hypothetical protein Tco_1017172 [Tanacetum coccineum]|uniref:Uncharacterized protein n=1 Tax=Tanacetum coccineum TaxID=301880 RepID=A0ABQ5FTA8_9ASTR
MHTSSSWIRKSSELTLKYFVRSSRSVPDSLTKILLNLPPKKKWFHLSRNSDTLASASLGSPQVLIGSSRQELKSVGNRWSIKSFKILKNIRLDFATGKATPKKARKFKKIASPSKKQTLVLEDEPAKKPKWAKHHEPAKKSTPTKDDKKVPAKVARSKGIKFLSDVALLEEAQLKKALKRSKRETTIHQAGGSSEGVDSKSEGDSGDEANEQGNDEVDKQSDDDHEQANDERTESNDEEEETQDDEYIHTLDDYVPTDDETNDESDDVTEEEYERINEELYGDVNISLTDAEPADKEKDDKEMTVAGHVNVNQEGACNQVKDDAQATRKTKGPILTTTSTTDVSESETLVALQLRITNLEKDIKELKTIDHSTSLLSTIKSKVPNAIKEYLGTSLDVALYKVLKKHDADIIKEHSIPAEIVERLRQEYVPEKSTEDIRKIKMEHARKQQEPKETITSSDTSALEEFDKKKTLFQTMTNSKSFNRNPKSKSSYINALMMFEAGDTQEPQNQGQDVGNTDDHPNIKATPKHDWFKKPERPSTPDSDWNVRKSIDFRPPQTWISKIAQAEKPPLSFDELMSTPIDFSAYVMNHLKIDKLTQEHLVGPAFNLLKGTCKSRVELEYNIEECYKAVTDRLDWNNPEGKEYPFDLSKPLPLIMERGRQVVPVDYFINNDLEYLRGGSSSKKYTTSTTKTKAAKYDIPGIEDMVPSLWSPVKWYDYGYLEEIEVRREDQQLYKFKEALRMFTRRIVILKRVEDLQLGVESYQKKLNITKPQTFKSDISNKTPYTAYINPQGIIYVDKYNRNKLMRSDELYKFSDGMLTYVRTVLHDIASNLRMDYLSKRR